MATRIHLCGRLTATIEGQKVDAAFAGRQARLLFAYLVSHRLHTTPRARLVDALWPDDPPPAVDSAVSALLSKLRKALGAGALEGRHELRLVLPDDAWVDTEAAAVAVHRADAAIARGDWHDAWVAARIAQHIARRPFLAMDSASWIEARRRELEGLHLRALELAAHASLEIGGSELATAARTAELLVRFAPFRESGHRYLMTALDAQENRAEALQVYERLRRLLRDELGAAPSRGTQELHRRLLA